MVKIVKIFKKIEEEPEEPEKPMTWVQFVKKYSEEHSLKYKDGLSAAKESWAEYKKNLS